MVKPRSPRNPLSGWLNVQSELNQAVADQAKNSRTCDERVFRKRGKVIVLIPFSYTNVLQYIRWRDPNLYECNTLLLIAQI